MSKANEKEVKDTRKLPEGVTLETLRSNWDIANREYFRAFRRARLLDAADRGKLWEAMRAANMPGYQVLPDTNHVSYVKENLVASIYSVGKCADVLPTTEEDKELVTKLNIILDHYWHVINVPKYQMEAGDRAALMNLGVTQVGWSGSLSGGGDPSTSDVPALKNIDPLKFMRDPYATSLDTAGFCITWDLLHINVLRANPRYREAMANYDSNKSSTAVMIEQMHDGPTAAMAQNNANYHRLIIHWVRTPEGIAEIHTLDNEYILFVIAKLIPNMYPFALLYCNLPNEDLIGTSCPAKIYANSVAYNLFNSILLTAEYKNQRPPKYIRTDSGLNVASFIQHGNDADYTFIVSGDASKAVHYHEFPTASPTAEALMRHLPEDVQMISGVDGRYTGRQTGSILTTGGIEAMLDQVTLIDAPKIKNYEDYTLRLSKLILQNLLEYAPTRKYFIKAPNKPDYEVIAIDFPKLKAKDVFAYEIHISSLLPKSRARIAQTANTLIEKQLQYQQAGGQSVDLMTPEEWLECQDIPIKERMLTRMGMQRSADYLAKTSEILYTYAGLVKNGVPSQEAMEKTAEAMQMRDTQGVASMDMPVDVLAQQPQSSGANPLTTMNM